MKTLSNYKTARIGGHMRAHRVAAAPSPAVAPLRATQLGRKAARLATVQVQAANQAVQGRIKADNPVAGKSFDYIIVGGGTAGCVLANRLSADGSKKVLVLETGKNAIEDNDVKIPAGITKLFRNPVLDWNLYTNVMKGVGEREVYLARGKLLGGSSSTNATLYHRGAAADYDGWGVPGWAAKDVLPFFKQAEDNSRGASEFHGTGGNYKVEDPRYKNDLHDVFFEAARQHGLSENPDFNHWGRDQEGFGTFQVTQHKGERGDAARQYLKPALGRANLTVLTDAQTTRVVLDNKKAVGIEFVTQSITGRTRHTAALTTGGEVIMCAGSVHTPQILMLSGIGDAAALREKDLPVHADLPAVGQNLQDHPACLTAFLSTKPGISVTDHIYDEKGDIRPNVVLDYLLWRKGPLTSTGCDRGAFLRTTKQHALPDLQMRFVPALSLDPDGVSSYSIFGRLKAEGFSWPTGWAYQIIACRPKSRGHVALRTDSIFDAPLIDAGFLKDAADLETLRAGMKLSRAMSASAGFQEINGGEFHPGPECKSDHDLDEYIRRSLHSANAVVGSCRMGTDARTSVVDAELRVHGLTGLRVVDASVIPTLPGGQTGAPTVMIAERAAQMIGGRKGAAQAAAALA